MSLKPVNAGERIDAVDILRGFAVFGMFVVHMTVSPWGIGVETGTSSLDSMTFNLIETYWWGRFVALFSILFGIGFVIQRDRALSRGEPFAGLFYRRLAGLLIIALTAYVFIPAGDALVLYALFGLSLPLVGRLPARAIPVLIVGALIVGVAPSQFITAASAATGSSPAAPSSFGDFVVERGLSLSTYFTSPLHFLKSMHILAFMLFGMWVGQSGLLVSLTEKAKVIQTATVWLVAVGLMFSSIVLLTDPLTFGQLVVLRRVSSLLLALGYAGVILWLLQDQRWRDTLKPVGDIGRLAFTNYLINSAIGVYLFHPIGLGLANVIGPFEGLFLALAIYWAQMRMSTIWLKHFRFGPIEYVWRSMTYGRIVSIRVDRPVLSDENHPTALDQVTGSIGDEIGSGSEPTAQVA